MDINVVMHWSFFIALKQLFPSHRYGTIFTWLSLLGVALGVAVLFIVQSVMNGFQNDIQSNIVKSQGQLRVESSGTITHFDYQFLEKSFSNFQEIARISPYVTGEIVILRNNTSGFALAKGIDPNTESGVTCIQPTQSVKSIRDLSNNEVFIEENLFHSLQLTLGDVIEVYSLPMIFEISEDNIPLPREARVVGIFAAGSYNLNGIIAPISFLQDLYSLENEIHGITLKLHPSVDVSKFAETLQNKLGMYYKVTDWKNFNKELLFALRWEKTMMFFVLLFILLIASFSISCTLITNVVRKTKEIALINAIGGSRRGILLCYCFQGFFIGILGTIGGMLMGFVVLAFRNSITATLEKLLCNNSASNYLSQFVHLPVQYSSTDIFIISALSIGICTLAGLFPAIKACHINTARALRFEQ